ncbi:MAG: DHH family phosphoesterase [Desulfobaccales bacterium]
MRKPVQRLYQLFSRDDRLLILINPDPDSIASALALKRLLWHRLSGCIISTICPITRPQNQRLVNLLEITLTPLKEIAPGDFPRKALVDNQPGHREELDVFHFDAIIDHHPRLPGTQAEFVDIRPEYGATATIMTEYLREARITPSLKLATALYYAIKTDTANFERPAVEADMRAFHYLFRFTRQPVVRRLESSEFNLDMLHFLQLALNRFCLRQNRIYAFLGVLAAPDILVILADFFLRAGEIAWTIVAGIYQKQLVVIFRNDGLHKNANRLAVKAFGQLGQAGGHLASARAEIPLEKLELSPKASWQEWQSYLIRLVERQPRLQPPVCDLRAPAPASEKIRKPRETPLKQGRGSRRPRGSERSE